jgi:hypothetical protein
MFSSHPGSRRLLVAGSVCWIISGLNLREPLHAGGVNFRDPVFERGSLDLILDLAIPQGAFKCDELPFQESLGELRQISPGIDAMPFGAGFVVAFVVLPAFLGCNVEDDELFAVLSVLASAFCPRRPMRVILLNMVSGSVSFGLSAFCGTCLPGGCAVATHSQGDWMESAERDPSSPGARSPHLLRGAQRILGRRACVRRAGGALSAAR